MLDGMDLGETEMARAAGLVGYGTKGKEAPITGELRRFVVLHTIGDVAYFSDPPQYDMRYSPDGLWALCDAVDAVYDNLVDDLEHARAERDSMAAELERVSSETHEFAPESHYMLLPKDADGVPIHPGEMVVNEVRTCCPGEAWTVTAVGEDGVVLDNGLELKAYECRHADTDGPEWLIGRALAFERRAKRHGFKSRNAFYGELHEIVRAACRLAGDGE